MAVKTSVLAQGWLWKQRNLFIESVLDELKETHLAEWNEVEAVPSEVHVELMKVGKIPHPYVGANEHTVQWVGEREWLYATSFDFENIHDYARLVFEGLDTFCTVYLNGEEILKAENMFTPHEIQLDPKTLRSKNNNLLLHFRSAKLIAKELEKKYGRVRAGSCNLGDPSRVYVRKAQYDWRWDWGPELMTVGIWRPVFLQGYNTRLADIHTKAVSADLHNTFSLDVKLEGIVVEGLQVKVVMKDAEGRVVRQEGKRIGKEAQMLNTVKWSFNEQELKLWWPAGYGEQALYTINVTLEDQNGAILDKHKSRIGFRHIRLVQNPLSEPDQYGKGTTFYFEVNGVAMFMGGSNWIPADNFLTTIEPERYRRWLKLLRDGNQNMVRVWGGGIYESDIFYDICDELGLLVWQDFQFACGVYPAHEEFVRSVRKEAEENVKRLRHHPCLALLCGNNEDYQQILQWGGISELPARLIYEEVLPEVVSRLMSPETEIPYWRGSPYGGENWDTADPTVGDVHQWNIWGGAGRPYQDYDILGGREFGIPAFPALDTIKHWMDGAPESQWHSQSKLMVQHNKAGLHERRFAVLMNDNFRITGNLESHVFLTQLMQSEAVGHAYRSWRREWRGEGKEYCGGVLVWQSNDCWPVTSWAIADYFLRPKPVYYTIAREMKPITVGIARLVRQNRETDRPRQFYEFGAFQSRGATIDVWGTNGTLQARNATLELGFIDIASGWMYKEMHEVVLEANQSTEIVDHMPVMHPPIGRRDDPDGGEEITASHSVVVWARLMDVGTGKILARHVDWPQPYRVLDIPDPGLSLTVEGEHVRVEVRGPIKGLVLSVQGDGVEWEDNNMDIVPGDGRIVRARGLGGRQVVARYLGKEA